MINKKQVTLLVLLLVGMLSNTTITYSANKVTFLSEGISKVKQESYTAHFWRDSVNLNDFSIAIENCQFKNKCLAPFAS